MKHAIKSTNWSQWTVLLSQEHDGDDTERWMFTNSSSYTTGCTSHCCSNNVQKPLLLLKITILLVLRLPLPCSLGIRNEHKGLEHFPGRIGVFVMREAVIVRNLKSLTRKATFEAWFKNVNHWICFNWCRRVRIDICFNQSTHTSESQVHLSSGGCMVMCHSKSNHHRQKQELTHTCKHPWLCCCLQQRFSYTTGTKSCTQYTDISVNLAKIKAESLLVKTTRIFCCALGYFPLEHEKRTLSTNQNKRS